MRETAAPCLAIPAGLGLGKTEATLRELLQKIDADPSFRSVLAIPTHAVAEEIAKRIDQMAGRRVAAVWRGTHRPDPAAPERTMCRMPKSVEAVRNAGGGVRAVCGGPRRGWCQFNPLRPGQTSDNTCSYRKQFAAAEGAAVWIITHAMLL
jgi:hypothetical protein